jgi:hypothetical protein
VLDALFVDDLKIKYLLLHLPLVWSISISRFFSDRLTITMNSPDLAELLAHLDFIVKEEPNRSSLDDDASEAYICKVLANLSSKFLNRYSAEQIKSQLYEEFCKVDAYPEYNLKLLFLYGSSQLVLEEEVKRQMEEYLGLIEQQERFRYRQLRPRPVDVIAENDIMLVTSLANRASGTRDNKNICVKSVDRSGAMFKAR